MTSASRVSFCCALTGISAHGRKEDQKQAKYETRTDVGHLSVSSANTDVRARAPLDAGNLTAKVVPRCSKSGNYRTFEDLAEVPLPLRPSVNCRWR